VHRHARPGALLIIFVLVLLAGAVSLAGPAAALTGATSSTVDRATIAPHPDDDKVAPAPVHLTAPTPSGLPAEAAQRPTAGPGSSGEHPRHPGPAAQETGTWQERAPPAIADR
jgi:hypothetical protein